MNPSLYLPVIGRVLVGLPFVLFGVGKIADFSASAASVEAVGIPLAPVALVAAIALEVVGGLFMIVGYRVRIVAAALAAFSLATALLYHSNLADLDTFSQFFKNVMLAGALLHIAGSGAGPISLDERRAKRA